MKFLRRVILPGCLALLLAGGYIAMPFHTAWSIREAARTGDTAYLSAKIDWAGIKETLKPTIARMALNLPAEMDPNAAPAEAGASGEPARKPSLWQRFKAYAGQGVVNKVVDQYVTPEGLPQLFTLKKSLNSVRDTVTGSNSEPRDLAFSERFKRFWARVERAEFKSLTRFEIDVRDKLMPERRFDGVLELRGMEWKLTELRVRDGSPAKGAATAQSGDILTDAGTAEPTGATPADPGPAETLPTDK